MADQNQNHIPGTLGTLKKDLDLWSSNPQDRLQQSGNFVQARPDLSNNLGVLNTEDELSSKIPTLTSTPLSGSKVESQKKDIPSVNSESKTQTNYSWSNMSSPSNSVPAFNPNNINDSKPIQTKQSQSVAETKLGFSVLDDSIDLPLDASSSIQTTPSNINVNSNPNNTKETSPIISQIETNKNNSQFDISSLNLEKDTKESKPKKSSTKTFIPVAIVIVLLGLIGGGVYFYFNISRTDNTLVTNNTDKNIDTDNTNQDPEEVDNSSVSISNFTSPLIPTSTLDVPFIDSEPIRKTISTVLTDKKDTLIELNLTKDSNTVSLVDIADIMSITIASIGTIEGYKLYAYNQQGVYKLAAVLGLSSDQSAKTFVENWSNSIPRDLAGFSINLPSRIVNNPQIKTSTITNNSGKNFENYYYNYTSVSDSIDVSSYEKFILLASSQDSMRYILEQIK
jgi:hypothetical protein